MFSIISINSTLYSGTNWRVNFKVFFTHLLSSSITMTFSWMTYRVAWLNRETFTAGLLFPALLFIWTLEQVQARHLLCCMVCCITALYTCWTSHASSSCNDRNMFRHHASWHWRSLCSSCHSHARCYGSDYETFQGFRRLLP